MSQYTRVQKVLASTQVPLALHEIHEAIRIQFGGQLDSEAGISARIRDIRFDLTQRGAGYIYTERVEGKAYLRYRLIESASGSGHSNLFAD